MNSENTETFTKNEKNNTNLNKNDRVPPYPPTQRELEQYSYIELKRYLDEMSSVHSNALSYLNIEELMYYEKLVHDYEIEENGERTISLRSVLSEFILGGSELTPDNITSFSPFGIRDGQVQACGPKDRKKIIYFIDAFSSINQKSNWFQKTTPGLGAVIDVITICWLYSYSAESYYRKNEGAKSTAKELQIMIPYFSIFKSLINVFDSYYVEYSAIEKRLFTIMLFYKIDRIFKFFKVYQLSKKRSEILHNETRLNRAILYSNFQFNDAAEIIAEFDNHVFKDPKFVDFCLKTEYHDPLDIFYSKWLDISYAYISNRYIPECHFDGFDIPVSQMSFLDLINLAKSLTIIKISNSIERRDTKLTADVIDDGKKYQLIHDAIKADNDIKNDELKRIEFNHRFRALSFTPDRIAHIGKTFWKDTDFNETDAQRAINEYMKKHENKKDGINLHLDEMIQIEEKYSGFWERYYFACRDELEEFIESYAKNAHNDPANAEENEHYMSYLFRVVNDDLKEQLMMQ